jgi:hypothetical protein
VSALLWNHRQRIPLTESSNQTSSTKCFVNWLLFSDRLEIADCFGYSSFLHFRVSNLFLAAFVAVCCFFVFLMLTAMCCLFFWLQRKKANNRKMPNKSNFIVKERSTGIHSKTPVIRSEDVISFVLPAVRNVPYYFEKKILVVECRFSCVASSFILFTRLISFF